MRRIKDLFARHLWLQFTAAWLLAAAFVLLLNPGRSPLGVLVRVVACSLGAVWMTVRRRQRERAVAGGSADELVVLDHMLRRGEVPQDAERRHAMRELVDQRLNRTRHRKSALVFIAALLIAVVVLSAFTSSLWHTIGFGVFSAVFFAYLYLVGGATLHRLQRMRDALADTTPADRADTHMVGGHIRHAA
ncbi:hypothetical protein [Streptomyces sp. IBSBF 2435]|uniref:hypothetical protein n=1 Tax=Streptomyces sp. IBSBF 2435 TaxID=2903531 RepID=UPI002FDBF259